ncbi:hypothetical protein BVRB_039470 [Beta vulgaris subsp. vulgaris]|uniref:UBC core domain-containing protein n=1 Tax=Beta vulgaris subsp. vulgaris TaxID=3555 RepID=A0A0J7YPL9_BETVV|nr:hypothetical protein BVRB_039470 [Beta vulgaris subsp. vulgaris]
MEEKWRPILGVESILISVVSLLSDPNLESPANIDASINLLRDPEGYRKRIRRLVRRSVEMI